MHLTYLCEDARKKLIQKRYGSKKEFCTRDTDLGDVSV